MKSTFVVITILAILVGGIFWKAIKYTPTKTNENSKNIQPPAETPSNDISTDVSKTASNTIETVPAVPGNDIKMEYPVPDPPLETTLKTFTLESFSYGFEPKEIRVHRGDTVTIVLTSTDGFHGFTIDDYDVHSDTVRTGNTTQVTFVANKTGTYMYYCPVGSHKENGMIGKLIVE